MDHSPNAKVTTGFILLAAGESKRMGSPKQLLRTEGESIIHQVTKKALRSTCFPVVVVVGSDKDQVTTEIENLPVFIEQNDRWKQGMSTSIKQGIHALTKVYAPVGSAIISVVDQPFITTILINQLVKCFETSKKSIVASSYAGIVGTPAVFDKKWFADLQMLQGDRGAKKLLGQCPASEISTVEFKGGEIELNTLEDFLLYQQMVDQDSP